MRRPLVSIVTPVYNGAAYIGRAIESALAQTYPNFELIIVNDGSRDESRGAIEAYLDRPNIRYYEQANGGVAAARNTALRLASGEFIAFLDQDDEWLPGKLAQQVDYLLANDNLALVHGYQSYINQAGEECGNPKDWIGPLEGFCLRELFSRNRIAILTVLLRRSCLERVGGFQETIPGADDYELWLRLALLYPFGFLPNTFARYRLHETNVSRDTHRMTMLELAALESFLRKHSEARRLVGSSLLAERLGLLNYQAGGWQIANNQDFESARAYFRKAVKYQPTKWRNWRRLAWSTLSPAQRRALSWYGARLGAWLGAKS